MLTDIAIRKSKTRAKGYYLSDRLGLCLYVSHTGGRYWRFRYQWQGRGKILGLGEYPALSLEEARAARDAARALVKTGRDPASTRRASILTAQKVAAETFELIAREWHAKQIRTWAARHAVDVLHSLERDVFPHLGTTPIREITAPDVLAVLRKIEARPAIETAHRVRQRMSAVFVYAIASGRSETDPAAIVEKALAPVHRGRQPAVRTIEQAREVLECVEATPGLPLTKLAIRLLALTAVRPGTLATVPWTEFEGVDADNPTWLISSQRLKLRVGRKGDDTYDHLVPLSRQSLEVINAMRMLTSESPFVFPNVRRFHQPMSENAMGYMINRAGYHGRHVPHGWRATFSTVMNELNRSDREVIDLMLGHVPRNTVEGAYNRAEYMPERRVIAQQWADLLLVDRPPALDLLSFPRR